MTNERYNELAKQVVDACFQVHKELGPGLLESAYEYALLKEFELRNIFAINQVQVKLFYKGHDTCKHYAIDILAENEIILEIKCADVMHPVYTAQIISYLKLAQKKLGFLVNFHVPLIKDGIKRYVNNFLKLSAFAVKISLMLTLNVSDLNTVDLHNYLQHAIAPRPICFASTINKEGEINLSPFSFFNLFSSNPPIVIFSPSRRVRDNTTKHTLQNILEVPEVVINIVTYDMVQQISLASCEYPKGINEFEKAGFTMQPSTIVKPPMVKESKIKLECRVNEVKPLGTAGGAGNLVIAEILVLHIDESILDDTGKIDQRKLDLVARLGNNWYSRANADTIFEVEKPNLLSGIGVDKLPASIRNSDILTGNNLGQLANVHEMPVVDATFDDDKLKNIILYYSISPAEMEKELHYYAKELLEQGKVAAAWQILLASETT